MIKIILFLGKVEEDADETKLLIEKLEELKETRMKFINDRVSSPNPLSSYGEIMKALEKISNEESRQRTTALVMDVWNKAIS